MVKTLLFIFIFYCSSASFSQKWEQISTDTYSEVLNDIANAFKTLKNYKVETYHASYKGLQNKIPYDDSKGFIIKLEKTYHTKSMGIETIQDKKLKIILYKEEKLMVLASVDNVSGDISLGEYKNTLKLTQKIVRKKTEGYTVYKVIMKTGQQLDSYELKIGVNNLVYSIILNASKDLEWKNKSGELQKAKPRIEIIYKNYQIPYSAEEIISTAKIVDITKEKVTPLGDYKNYEISDTRYQP